MVLANTAVNCKLPSNMPALLRQVGIIAGKLQTPNPQQDAGHLDELRLLIRQGAPLEDADDEGWTAYLWAVRCGLYEVAYILEEAGADTSRRADAELIAAIFRGDVQLARKALSAGAKGNLKCGYWSALGLASYHGQPEIVAAIIEAGVSVPADALEPLGEMDITDWKIESDKEEQAYARVAELLIAHGASPNINTNDGKPLIENFPAKLYPNIRRVLSDALTRSGGKP